MTKSENNILDEIVNGIQERKGHNITIVDMNHLPDAPCPYFVISDGDSVTHVSAIGNSVKDHLRNELKQRPYASDGFENSKWIAMDYGEVMVHIFQREDREFYDLEHLWEDAKITNIPDIY